MPTRQKRAPHDTPSPPDDVWLNELDAAMHIGYSGKHLKRLRRDGKGPAYAINAVGSIRYRRSHLDAWVQALAAPDDH